MTSDDPAVITLTGPITAAGRHAFKADVLGALERGAKSVVVDFTACGYVDTEALGVLITLRRSAHHCGAQLVLAGLNPDLRAQLQVTRLTALFTIANTTAEALACLGTEVVAS